MILGIIGIAIFLTIISFLLVSFYVTYFGGGPFSSTPIKSVKKILKLTKIKKGENFYDIGAGDGRFLNYAEKIYHANAIGFEINPFVYFWAKIRHLFGWKGKIILGDFKNQDLKSADKIFCYMLPETLEKFRKIFEKKLRKNTQIISYRFKIENWTPKKTIKDRPYEINIYELPTSKQKNNK